jgi:hypothetical protein
VSDGAGGVLVAWEDDRTLSGRSRAPSSGPGGDVYAQRLGPMGTPLWTVDGVVVGAAPDEVSGGPANQLYPAIISDGTGGAIVAWLDERDSAHVLGRPLAESVLGAVPAHEPHARHVLPATDDPFTH